MSNEQAQDPLKPAAGAPQGSPEGATPTTEGVAAYAQAGAEPAGNSEVESLKQQLSEALAKSTQHYDAYVRAHAEMENIRRRAQEDVSKAHKFSIESFAESLLPVRDSLEMALKSEKMSVDSLRQGVDATLKQLASVFERNKLLEIDPVGQRFDPNHHQAISMVPGASLKPPVPANHVVSVLQKGYLINDRILRPALVTVAQS